MSKKIVSLLVVGLLLVGLIQVGFAYDGGPGPREGLNENCWVESLTPEEQVEVNSIMDQFRAKMEALRMKMVDLRGSGEIEDIREVQAERFEIRSEKFESLSPYTPADYSPMQENMNKLVQKQTGSARRGR